MSEHQNERNVGILREALEELKAVRWELCKTADLALLSRMAKAEGRIEAVAEFIEGDF